LKRFRRILFNMLTAISLILAFATAGLLVRSFAIYDKFYVERHLVSGEYLHTRVVSFKFAFGMGAIGTDTRAVHSSDEATEQSDALPMFSHYTDRSSGGPFWGESLPLPVFRVWSWRDSVPLDPRYPKESRELREMGFPIVLPLLLFLLAPSTYLLLFLRTRNRKEAGHCPACGYDTRANPSQCSECGIVIDPRSSEVRSNPTSTRSSPSP
jgi:hypothetical protein